MIIDDDLTGELGDMPEVTESMESGEENGNSAPLSDSNINKPNNAGAIPANAVGKVDAQGRSFDSGLHCVDENGAAILNAKGKLKSAFRGRPPKNGKPTTSSVLNRPRAQNSVSHAPEEKAPSLEPRTMGVQAAGLLIAGGRMLGGEEWEPRKEDGIDERANLEKAFGDYFVAKEMSDLPPSMALIFVVAAYSIPRFTMPATKKRTFTMAQKIKLWWTAKKMEKENKKAPPREEKKAE